MQIVWKTRQRKQIFFFIVRSGIPDMTPRNIIGPQLRRFRSQEGLSQQMLAALLQRKGWDVSRGTIARIEGQVRWVADFELLFLSEVLSISIPSLFGPGESLALAHQLVGELEG